MSISIVETLIRKVSRMILNSPFAMTVLAWM